MIFLLLSITSLHLLGPLVRSRTPGISVPTVTRGYVERRNPRLYNYRAEQSEPSTDSDDGLKVVTTPKAPSLTAPLKSPPSRGASRGRAESSSAVLSVTSSQSQSGLM